MDCLGLIMNRTDWLTSLAGTATPGIEECIDVLGGNIELLYELESTEQDSQWHAEGNVYIHTSMVLAEVYKLLASDASHIVGLQRQALVLSALLHDIAKPIRTRRYESDGQERIGAPQHAFYGRSYLAFKLPELELSFQVIWSVLNLVGEHHTPKKMIVSDSAKSDYYLLARQANLELLYWLEIADMRGRICSDLAIQLQYLEDFRMFAEEYGVWGQELDVRAPLKEELTNLPKNSQNYIYANALHQIESGKITMAEEALATTYQHRELHPHLVVLCGPSGSGKSTWQKQYYPDYDVVSLDILREKFNGDRESQSNKGQIQQYAKEQLRVALRKNGKVVWDATNLRKDFRSVICTLGMDYNALVSLIVFLLPEKTIIKKNQKRKNSVPESVLKKQLNSYQMPLLTEAHQFQIISCEGKMLYESGYFTKNEINN